MTLAWKDGPVRQSVLPPGTDTPTWKEVGGVVRGPWGITEERNDDEHYWNLTHTPTGCTAGWFALRRHAKLFAAALDRLPVDWSTITMENYGATLGPHRPTLKRLGRYPTRCWPLTSPHAMDHVRRVTGWA